MKKRILSFAMVCVLMYSMCLTVSAASASDSGVTTGGTDGRVSTTADLYVYTDHAVGETWSEAYDTSILKTIVKFFYRGMNNNIAYCIDQGHAVISVSPPNNAGLMSGINGESFHLVSSTKYGTWTSALTANVW